VEQFKCINVSFKQSRLLSFSPFYIAVKCLVRFYLDDVVFFAFM